MFREVPNKFADTETGQFLGNMAAMQQRIKGDRLFSGPPELLIHPQTRSRLWTSADAATEPLQHEMLQNPEICRMKACFNNAALAALAYPDVKYVEGYASSAGPIPFPVEHAWNVLPDGTIVDCTWCTHGAQAVGREYIGIVVPDEVVEEWFAAGEAPGLFNWMKGDELLTYLTDPPDWMWSPTPGTAGNRGWSDIQSALVPRKHVLLDRPATPILQEIPEELDIIRVSTTERFGGIQVHSDASQRMGNTAYQIVVAHLYLDLLATVRRLGSRWIKFPPAMLTNFDAALDVLEKYGQELALELDDPPSVPEEVTEAVGVLRGIIEELAGLRMDFPENYTAQERESFPEWVIDDLAPWDPWVHGRRPVPRLSEMWRHVWYRELLAALVGLQEYIEGETTTDQHALEIAQSYWARALARVAVREGHQLDTWVSSEDILDEIEDFFTIGADRPEWELYDWTIESIPVARLVDRSRWPEVIEWIQRERAAFSEEEGYDPEDWGLVDYPIIIGPDYLHPGVPVDHWTEPAPPAMVIIDGNHRLAEAIERGDETIEAYVGYSPSGGAGIVGVKRIGPKTWAHRSYAAREFPAQKLRRAQAVVERDYPGHDWVVVRHNAEDGSFAFVDSPDFDTAAEPVVGDSVLVYPDGTTRLTRQAADPQIWHHKHLFVDDDYAGFDVEASRTRSAEWGPHVRADERRRMGRRSVWEEMRPRWEGTTGAPPLRKRVPEELRRHVREITYRGDPVDLFRGAPGPVTTSRLSAPDTLEGLQRRIAGLPSTRTKVLAGYIAATMVFPLYTDLYGADLNRNNVWVWPSDLIDRIRSQFTREFDAETSTDVIQGWLEAPVAALEVTRASLDGRLPDPSEVDVSRLSRLVSAVWHLAQVSVHHLPWGWVPPLGWRPSPEASTPERAAAFAVSAVYFALHGMLRFYTGGRGDDTLSSPLGTGNQLITGAVHYAAMAAEANAPESRWAYRRFITAWQHNVLRAIPVREGMRAKLED